MKKLCAMLALASCFSAACRAVDPPTVPEDIAACSKLEDAGERIRCYDARLPPQKAPPAATPVAPPVPAVTAAPAAALPAAPPRAASPTAAPVAPASPTEQFGSNSLPASARPRTKKPRSTPTLLSSITTLNTDGPAHRYIISLANGQVWRQEGASDVTVFFRVGQDVRIEEGAFGSYHLFTSSTGTHWLQVTRIQ